MKTIESECDTGHKKEIDCCIQEYYLMLYRFCSRLLGDGEEARDVTQDTFLILNLNLNRKDTVVENRKAWLYRTAANRCTDFLRRRNRFRGIFFRNEFLPGTAEPADRMMEEEQRDRNLRASFSRLSVRDRLLLSLYRDGLTYADMASISGIRLTSIGKLLARAMARLTREVKRGESE